MSEKIDKFCKDLQRRVNAAEEKLNQLDVQFESATKDTVDSLREQVKQAKTKIISIQDHADAKVAELRERLGEFESGAKEQIDEHIAQLQQECENQFQDLQQSWGDVMTDVSGGLVF